MQISIKNLTKKYGELVALNNLSLELEDVSSLAIIGPSGGGKTTLLRILAGLEKPDSGSVTLNGHTIDFSCEKSLNEHRRRIAVVFQAYNLFPHLTAIDNIILPLTKTRGLKHQEAESKAVQLLSQLGLSEHMKHSPNQLSGGQKQRVAIARALSLQPEILLFDEPTSALDPEITAEILDVINGLRQENRNIILVTHEIGFARHACGHVAFVSEGQVETHGDSETLYDQSDSELFQRFISRIIGWKV
jgi:polar amino acid transport system ATP-binding protein